MLLLCGFCVVTKDQRHTTTDTAVFILLSLFFRCFFFTHFYVLLLVLGCIFFLVASFVRFGFVATHDRRSFVEEWRPESAFFVAAACCCCCCCRCSLLLHTARGNGQSCLHGVPRPLRRRHHRQVVPRCTHHIVRDVLGC